MARTAKRSSFRLVAPVAREHPTHASIAKVFTIEFARAGHVSPAGVVWWSMDAANYGGAVPGTRTARGIIAGCPDMIVLWRGGAFFIEVKTDTGELSDPQREVACGMLCSGVRFGIARNAEEALGLTDAWQIPRKGCVQIQPTSPPP